MSPLIIRQSPPRTLVLVIFAPSFCILEQVRVKTIKHWHASVISQSLAANGPCLNIQTLTAIAIAMAMATHSFKYWPVQILAGLIDIKWPMFECCLHSNHSNIGIQTLAPMFECRSLTVGNWGKSFSGCRGANKCVQLSDPINMTYLVWQKSPSGVSPWTCSSYLTF